MTSFILCLQAVTAKIAYNRERNQDINHQDINQDIFPYVLNRSQVPKAPVNFLFTKEKKGKKEMSFPFPSVYN